MKRWGQTPWRQKMLSDPSSRSFLHWHLIWQSRLCLLLMVQDYDLWLWFVTRLWLATSWPTSSNNTTVISLNPLTTNVPIIQKPVCWFAEQINWLVSIWLVVKGLTCMTMGHKPYLLARHFLQDISCCVSNCVSPQGHRIGKFGIGS